VERKWGRLQSREIRPGGHLKNISGYLLGVCKDRTRVDDITECCAVLA
jgi:hypothetical protein